MPLEVERHQPRYAITVEMTPLSLLDSLRLEMAMVDIATAAGAATLRGAVYAALWRDRRPQRWLRRQLLPVTLRCRLPLHTYCYARDTPARQLRVRPGSH